MRKAGEEPGFPRDQETFWMCRLINAPESWMRFVAGGHQGSWNINREVALGRASISHSEWTKPDWKKMERSFLHLVFFTCLKTPLEGSKNHLSWQRFKVACQFLIYSFLFLIPLARNSFEHLENIFVCIRQNYWCIQSTRWLINKNF